MKNLRVKRKNLFLFTSEMRIKMIILAENNQDRRTDKEIERKTMETDIS